MFSSRRYNIYLTFIYELIKYLRDRYWIGPYEYRWPYDELLCMIFQNLIRVSTYLLKNTSLMSILNFIIWQNKIKWQNKTKLNDNSTISHKTFVHLRTLKSFSWSFSPTFPIRRNVPGSKLLPQESGLKIVCVLRFIQDLKKCSS